MMSNFKHKPENNIKPNTSIPNRESFELSSSPQNDQWVKMYIQETTSLEPEILQRQITVPILYSPNSKQKYTFRCKNIAEK